MSGIGVFNRWPLVHGEGIVSPEKKIVFKVYMYIYTQNMCIITFTVSEFISVILSFLIPLEISLSCSPKCPLLPLSFLT